MLTSVKLERFKAAYRPASIHLHPFTVIVGRNGSGKSTLLEALQWLDVTLRRDAVEACRRYFGVHDLINLRSTARKPSFQIRCTFRMDHARYEYRVRVEEDEDGTTPRIAEETFSRGRGQAQETLIEAPDSSDRLALARAATNGAGDVREFWRRATFLRLSPNRLAEGSLARRASSDPLLDEEGQMLPALLNDLTEEQRARCVELVQQVLPDMQEVRVSRPTQHRSERVHYELLERMPYRGRSGRGLFPIPAWMLSEGTRRLTAICALLAREPGPSLLCIEEIENGLDPWAVRIVLRNLQEAAERGVQVVVTTHSPWLLDEVPLEAIIRVRRSQGDTSYEPFDRIPGVMSFDPSIPAGTRYVHLEEGP